MNISIEIKAPELADAIRHLANALGGKQISQPTIEHEQNNTQPNQSFTAVPTAPIQQQTPTAPTNQAQPIPTQAPSYTMDQLAVAATQLVDAGKRNELVQLLASFGVQALTALPKEQYGAFATKLREMGAKI